MSEAAFMAMRVTGRHDKVVVLGSVHPEYRAGARDLPVESELRARRASPRRRERPIWRQ